MIVINKCSLASDPELLALCRRAVSAEYSFFRGLYPTFTQWFEHRVVPGIATGERTIVMREGSGSMAGVLILKHDGIERKLCTLRVRDELANRGLGIRLFQTAFSLLD